MAPHTAERPQADTDASVREAAGGPSIAVLIPCYQEARTIAKVVGDYRRQLPDARVYVYDNNSTDGTAAAAEAAGAIVRREKRQGKGYVVATMFREVEADIYVMVDGDDTYRAADVHALIEPIARGEADMIVGRRTSASDPVSFRRFHQFGNRLVCRAINAIFASDIRDVFSGYRVMTRALVKSVPVLARGFDVETELTLQVLYRQFVIAEVATVCEARPEGSHSKLRTVPDGTRVLLRLGLIFLSYKPLTVFGSLGLLALAASAIAGARPLIDVLNGRNVQDLSRAVVAAALAVASVVTVGIGAILHSTNFRLQEIERVILLRMRPPDSRDPGAG